MIAIVLGALVVVALPWWRPPDPLTGRQGLLTYAPSGLAQAVAGLPAGARVVTPQTWGSWFEWAAPDAHYFIDSRFELFPADVWADYDDPPRHRRRSGRRGAGSPPGRRRGGPRRRGTPGRRLDAGHERHRRRGLHQGPLTRPTAGTFG